MLDRLSGAVARRVSISVCTTFDLHAPGTAIRSNGLFLYARCRFCSTVISRTGRVAWRAARRVDEAYLAEMREVSTEFLRVAQVQPAEGSRAAVPNSCAPKTEERRSAILDGHVGTAPPLT
jgi:hypothetical protein